MLLTRSLARTSGGNAGFEYSGVDVFCARAPGTATAHNSIPAQTARSNLIRTLFFFIPFLQARTMIAARMAFSKAAASGPTEKSTHLQSFSAHRFWLRALFVIGR
jgi:hypothetical protein